MYRMDEMELCNLRTKNHSSWSNYWFRIPIRLEYIQNDISKNCIVYLNTNVVPVTASL